MTMTLIQTASVSGSLEATLSAIPSTFTDLLVVASLRDNASGSDHYIYLKFNGSTSSFSSRAIYGTGGSSGSSTSSTNDLERFLTGAGATANTFTSMQMYIPNYSAAINKAFSVDAVSENNSSSAWQTLAEGAWADTSAISSITIGNYNGNFVSGSTISIYGITKGSGGATAS